jgi:zinc protease
MNKFKLAALAALFPLSLFAQKTTSPKLPLDPAVRMGKLANGFSYYIRHNEEPKNRVLMYLVNKAGSVLEDEDQRGLAHFMEHMSFNGTVHFPHNDLVDYLQKAGVRFGADINAYTSFDETVYELPLPSDKPGILDTGILILHDWAQSATLDPTEIDKERGVVLEEKRLGKGAGERMQRQYFPVLLNNSRYAVRIPIGLDTVLDNFKRPVIYRFYHDWYRPDLQALIIVGDVNADSLVKVIKAKFADLKNPAHEKMRPVYTVPLTGKNQFIAVTDKEMTQTVAEVLIKHKDESLKTTAEYRREIIKNLFNQMLAERYAELSRQADPAFIGGEAGIQDFLGGLDSYDAEVAAKPGELEKGFKAVWRETERVKRFGFTATELKRAKAAYLSGLEAAAQEKDKTNSEDLVKEYQALFLKGSASPGIVKEYELTKADLPTISLADVNGLAKIYITGTNRDVLLMAPEKDKATLTDQETVNRWINAVAAENLRPYQDQVSAKPLLTGQPVPGKIVNETEDKSIHTTTLTLSNGIKVVLKPTDFKNDEIIFTSFAPGGTSLASDNDYQSAANAAAIIAASGAGNYNANELDKYLEGKQLALQPYIGERYQGVKGQSTVKDLESALALAYAYLTEPRKDLTIFDGLMQQSKAGLAHREDDPKSVFDDTVSAVLGNYHVRRTGPSLAKLAQVNLDSAYAFYQSRFAAAGGMTFTFSGSFTISQIKPLLEKYLGGLPAGNAETAKDLGIHVPEGRISKNVYKGSEPQSTVLLVFSGKFDDTQENRLKLDALKECLDIRLLQRLREDESGVYSPGVFDQTTKYPQGRYGFIIQFGCAPQNVDKLIASALDEMGKLKKIGPLQENLDKWRAEDQSLRETQLKTNAFWLSYLSGTLQDQDNPDELNSYPQIRDSLSVEQIKKAAQQYLSGDNYIRLVLLPEKK